MEKTINQIKAAVTAALGLLTGLWGWLVVLVWYIVTELGSMAENAAVMGAPVPQWLLKLLAMSKSTVDGSVAAVQTLPWNHRGWHCGVGRWGHRQRYPYLL